MTTNQDQVIRDLYYTVKNKKVAIEASNDKPNWVTNCAFRYAKDDKLSEVINIQTADTDTLIHIAGWLVQQEDIYIRGIKALGLPDSQYTWLGFSVNQWITDIGTRINRIRHIKDKKELSELEAKLNKILPPDFERQLELEAIMNSDVLK